MKVICFGGDEKSVEKRTSKEIEKKLAEWYKNEKKAIKILLLGTGESGKTTIIKQMKILHISGFSHSERLEKVPEIFQNVHEAIYDLVKHMPLLVPPIELYHQENKANVTQIQSIGPDPPQDFDQKYFDAVDNLWADPGVQECYQRSNEYQLIDSTKYFLDKLDVLRQAEYLPTDEDILHCRKKTTQIQKVSFSVQVPKKFGGGSQEFWMYDVGGQRGYRRKWIQVFEGIQAILFLVSSSDFDQTLREDTGVNRLKEALTVFDDVWNSRFLQDSGFILFLNKQDVLKEKIASGKSIGKYFPAYRTYQLAEKEGQASDQYLKTKCFIRDLFISKTIQKRKQSSSVPNLMLNAKPRELYNHFTTATDTANIRTVFDDVHTIIILDNLQSVGIN